MKNLKYVILPFAFLFTLSFAQSETDVDPIEKARQAKEAAEKAAAEADALKEAAVEAAAQQAAKEAREAAKKKREEAREAAKRKKEEEEARKLAEKQAAEDAELDAAAQAAAEEAKRKMAAELGLELDQDDGGSTAVAEAAVEEPVEEPASPKGGFSVGAAPSIGFISGETFTNVPVGATVVITIPYGFKLGPLDFTISAAFGGYAGSFDDNEFNPTIAGVGGNLTLANFVFTEGHAGLVGEGLGVRGFAGVTLERLMKKGLNLPFNVLVGGEGFIGNDVAGVGNPSYWGGLGVRLDYSF